MKLAGDQDGRWLPASWPRTWVTDPRTPNLGFKHSGDWFGTVRRLFSAGWIIFDQDVYICSENGAFDAKVGFKIVSPTLLKHRSPKMKKR